MFLLDGWFTSVAGQAVGDLAPLAAAAGGVGVLVTGLLLGIRHGIDWDHIAAITDVTSTSSVADTAEAAHLTAHEVDPHHHHGHGGSSEIDTHLGLPRQGPGAMLATPTVDAAARRIAARRLSDAARDRRRAIFLGTLYALGHALVVAVLGLLALAFGATLPDWVDPIMGRVVGITLLALGIWVFVSLYRYARHGEEFRLRSRWMLAFDGVRVVWRRLQARLHGHEHIEPLEMSSYGPRTAFAVGMIHGIGAETGSQVLIIAAVGGAASAGLGVPMMVAFIVGLLISNTAIVLVSASGFIASQTKKRVYVVVGVVAGVFSVLVGALFLLGAEGALPDLDSIFHFIG
jgi:cytochrome c biogenesis protein CcdA